jgi:hypothetical protein
MCEVFVSLHRHIWQLRKFSKLRGRYTDSRLRKFSPFAVAPFSYPSFNYFLHLFCNISTNLFYAYFC